MAPVPMTPDEYQAALEVLELAREALHAKGNPKQHHVQTLLILRAQVDALKPIASKERGPFLCDDPKSVCDVEGYELA